MIDKTYIATESPETDLTDAAAKRWLALVLGIALAVRLLVAFGLGISAPRIYDEQSYDEIAGSIASTARFADKSGNLTSLSPPLYPAMLAGVYRIWGNHNYLAARLAQAVLGALTVIPLFVLAKRMFSRRVGIWSAALYALEPSLAGFSGLLLSETLFTLLLVLGCLLMQQLLLDGRFRWAFLFGLTVGLAALTRSLLLPMLPLFLLFMCWALQEWKWPKRLALAATVGAVFFAVVGPWIVRNTRLEGTLTTIDAIGGRNLMMGNYEYTPLTRSWDTITMLAGTEQSWEVVLMRKHPEYSTLSQGGRDKLAMRYGLGFILSHPGLTIERSCVKFFDFWQLERTLIAGLRMGWWGTYPNPVVVLVALVMAGVNGFVLLMAIVGLCISRARDMRLQFFILLLILLSAAVHTLIFAHSRYRLPLTQLMLIYSGSALAAWRGGRIRWRDRRCAVACAVSLILVGSWIVQFICCDLQRFI